VREEEINNDMHEQAQLSVLKNMCLTCFDILKRSFNVPEPGFTILIVVSLFFMHGM